jgi:hypothetical protein
MDIVMGKGQVGISEKLGIGNLFKDLESLTRMKTGIYQSRSTYALEVGTYYLLAFMTPFFLFQSQLLQGVIINSMLVTGSLYTKGREMLPVIVLPSIATLAHGVLFGSLTPYLIVMLPFIWVSNAILVYSIKSLHLKQKKSFLSSAAIGSTLKTIFLLASTYTLFVFNLVPVEFLVLFGVLQLATALGASMLIAPIHSWRLNSKK